jgi:DNA-binding response OmpR family regulator
MPKEKILVVDDEPTIRWSLREALDCWGYEVVEAGTGAQAMAAVADPKIMAVLLDINLPDGSGLDLLRDIKGRRPQVAVVMVSAETFYDTAVSALRGGADDFIGKPVRLEELRFTIKNVIETAGRGPEPDAAVNPRILIVSDSADQIQRLQSLVAQSWRQDQGEPIKAEVTSVLFPEDWGYAAADKYDLALVDVGPELLETLLKAIRANSGQAEMPILVDRSRVVEAAGIAGLMPKYRAMPCGHDEMIRLTRRRLTSIGGRGQAKGLL